jgi:hypothetical protein
MWANVQWDTAMGISEYSKQYINIYVNLGQVLIGGMGGRGTQELQ